MHINIIVFSLSTTLKPDHQSGLGFVIDFLSSDVKDEIEKKLYFVYVVPKKYNNF